MSNEQSGARVIVGDLGKVALAGLTALGLVFLLMLVDTPSWAQWGKDQADLAEIISAAPPQAWAATEGKVSLLFAIVWGLVWVLAFDARYVGASDESIIRQASRLAFALSLIGIGFGLLFLIYPYLGVGIGRFFLGATLGFLWMALSARLTWFWLRPVKCP